MAENKKVKVDEEKCIGCGACEAVCPDGFEIVEGKAKVKSEDADCIKEAEESCPMEAITVEEE